MYVVAIYESGQCGVEKYVATGMKVNYRSVLASVGTGGEMEL